MEEKEVVPFSKYRKSSGTFIYYDPEFGEKQYDTARCRHCGFRWQVEPGSGKKRGWCFRCKGILCGKEWCLKECVPEEARLDIESGDRATIMKYIDTHFVQEYLHKKDQARNFMERYKPAGGIYLK